MNRRKISRKRFLGSMGLGLALPSWLVAASGQKEYPPPSGFSFQRNEAQMIAETDVLVVGGGPAGIGAAIGSRMTGADTLLLEGYGFLGGVAAWSLGMSINQMRPEQLPRSAVHELVIRQLGAYGPKAMKLVKHGILCQVEYLKASLMDSLDRVGCRYLVHLNVVDTVMEGDRIAGVYVATKKGIAFIRAKTVIDCTGDADVAFFAGAETLKDPDRVSPQTLALSVCNLREDDGRYKYRIDGETVAALRNRYPLVPDNWSVSRIAQSNTFYINHAGTKRFGPMDTTDPFVFSDAECKSRHQVIQMVSLMREAGPPEMRDLEFCATGPQIGIRESRRLKGRYVLTEEDAMNGSTFEDTIAWRSGPMDVGFTQYTSMKTHDVPYRALLPENIQGLLVAGRAVSATHLGASAGKSMGNCMATGHAAGVASALAVKNMCLPGDLKVSLIQEILGQQGVDLARGGREQSGDAFDSI